MDQIDQAVRSLMDAVARGQIEPIAAERLLNATSRLRANVPTGAGAQVNRRPIV